MQGHELAAELAERWGDDLEAHPWPERLRLLSEIHEQLLADLSDFALYSEVSPRFIAGLIAGWGAGQIAALEQAQIYANSADEGHRALAATWLTQNRTVKTDGPAARAGFREQRAAPRYVVNAPTHIRHEDGRKPCLLVDISRGGALIDFASPLSIGTHIELEIPTHGPEVGAVVRAALPLFGLAFAAPVQIATG